MLGSIPRFIAALGIVAAVSAAEAPPIDCWASFSPPWQWRAWCCDLSVSEQGRPECWDGTYSFSVCCGLAPASVAAAPSAALAPIDVSWFWSRSVNGVAIVLVGGIRHFDLLKTWLAIFHKIYLRNPRISTRSSVSIVCMDRELRAALLSIDQQCLLYILPDGSPLESWERHTTSVTVHVVSELVRSGLNVLYSEPHTFWTANCLTVLHSARQLFPGAVILGRRANHTADVREQRGPVLSTDAFYVGGRVPDQLWAAVQQHAGAGSSLQDAINRAVASMGVDWMREQEYDAGIVLGADTFLTLLPESSFPAQANSSPLLDFDPSVRCHDGVLDESGNVCCASSCDKCYGVGAQGEHQQCPKTTPSLFTARCCMDGIAGVCQTEEGPPPCIGMKTLPEARQARGDPGCTLAPAAFFNASGRALFVSEDAHLFWQRNPLWLASFPGSGNTWLRRLLEAATQVTTGSVYHDDELRLAGFAGEGVSRPSEVLGVKSHAPLDTWYFSDVDDKPANGSVLLMVRNPLRAALALTSFILGAQEHGVEIRRDLLQARYDDWLEGFLNAWKAHTEYFLYEFPGRRMIVRFEDFEAAPDSVVAERILPWMDVDTRNDGIKARLECRKAGDPTEQTMRSITRRHTQRVNISQSHRSLAWRIAGKALLELGYRELREDEADAGSCESRTLI